MLPSQHVSRRAIAGRFGVGLKSVNCNARQALETCPVLLLVPPAIAGLQLGELQFERSQL
jgi:hypothetical protein